jgi:hypothetical protein
MGPSSPAELEACLAQWQQPIPEELWHELD